MPKNTAKKDSDAVKNKKTTSDAAGANPADSNQTMATPSGPLFIKQPRALDKTRHAKAGVRPSTNYDFAKETNSLPLSAIEFIEASKHYPIVFTNAEQPAPVAIVGLKQHNYFIEADGKWQDGAYIPAYVRQYPFVFFEHKEENKFYLCIDEAAKSYNPTASKDDRPLFDDKGQPSEATNNALDFCTAFYNHHQITRNLCKDLKKHELLMPYQSAAELPSGEKINLAGFQIIDEQKLNALPDKIFLEFREKGWLAFIYLTLSAASNWKKLFDAAVKQTDSKPYLKEC